MTTRDIVKEALRLSKGGAWSDDQIATYLSLRKGDNVCEEGMKVSFPVYGKSPIQEATDALMKEQVFSKLRAMDLGPDEIGFKSTWKNGEFKIEQIKAEDFYKEPTALERMAMDTTEIRKMNEEARLDLERIKKNRKKLYETFPHWGEIKQEEHKMEETMRQEGVRCAGPIEPVDHEKKHWLAIRLPSMHSATAFKTKEEASKYAVDQVERGGGMITIFEMVATMKAQAKEQSFKSK